MPRTDSYSVLISKPQLTGVLVEILVMNVRKAEPTTSATAKTADFSNPAEAAISCNFIHRAHPMSLRISVSTTESGTPGSTFALTTSRTFGQ